MESLTESAYPRGVFLRKIVPSRKQTTGKTLAAWAKNVLESKAVANFYEPPPAGLRGISQHGRADGHGESFGESAGGVSYAELSIDPT